MAMFAGLDVGFKRTAVCVIDGAGVVVWRGVVDTHPEMIAAALQRWRRELEKVGLESGSLSPWLARELAALGLPVVCMDARRAADAVKARRVKTDKADALALAEMLRTGWYSAVHVEERGEPSAEGAAGGARSVSADEAGARQPSTRAVAAVRDQAAVAPGHEEVRRGGA
jgi:hypothetical protein